MSDKFKRDSIERRMCAVSEDVLFWAFRYALGRMTVSVSDLSEAIMMNVSNITKQTAAIMIKEIDESNERGGLGMDIDKERWLEVRELLQKKVGK